MLKKKYKPDFSRHESEEKKVKADSDTMLDADLYGEHTTYCIDVVKLASTREEHLYLFSRKAYLLKVVDILSASFIFLYRVGKIANFFSAQPSWLVQFYCPPVEKKCFNSVARVRVRALG